jgi:hypothetical protein
LCVISVKPLLRADCNKRAAFVRQETVSMSVIRRIIVSYPQVPFRFTV